MPVHLKLWYQLNAAYKVFYLLSVIGQLLLGYMADNVLERILKYTETHSGITVEIIGFISEYWPYFIWGSIPFVVLCLIIWTYIQSSFLIPNNVVALKNYWKLYLDLVEDMFKIAEKRALTSVSSNRIEEKKSALENYLGEIDRLSRLLPLRQQLKKPRLVFYDEDFTIAVEGKTPPAPTRLIAKINTIDDILHEYQLATKYNQVNTIKHNVEASYHRFLKELTAIESLIA
ncbi:MAG: hypothetical protein ACUZ8A_08870 [Candidatus Bathyanammoxibius sp.]